MMRTINCVLAGMIGGTLAAVVVAWIRTRRLRRRASELGPTALYSAL